MFTHTFKYTDGTGVSYYLQGVAVWPALHIFKCRHHTYVYIYSIHYMLVFHLLEKCSTSVVQMQPRLSQKLGIRKY
jgi:hypothetical protein